jgi:hypothetical protein
MNNLKQSLLILDYFAWVLMRKAEILYVKSLHVASTQNKVFDDDNYHMLSQSSIMNACSFMEEYHKEFGVKTESEFKDKINITKKICAPYTRAIAKWSDLNGYRNVIAHTLRDKNGQLILLNPDHDKIYNTPNNPLEWLLLRNCMIGVKNILNIEFNSELEEARDEINAVKYNFKSDPIMSEEALLKTFHAIVNDSESIARSYGKYYDPNITRFYNNNKPVVEYGMMESY